MPVGLGQVYSVAAAAAAPGEKTVSRKDGNVVGRRKTPCAHADPKNLPLSSVPPAGRKLHVSLKALPAMAEPSGSYFNKRRK